MLAEIWQSVTRFQTALQQHPMVVLGLVAVVGYYFGGLARRVRLPSIIGFMVLGVLLGPSVLGLLVEPQGAAEGNLDKLSFLTEVALGLVAFTIGSELSIRALRDLGGGIVSIIFAESFGAFILVTLAVYPFCHSWPLAILFGSVAPASAPAGTVAVIREVRSRGPLTKALYAVVGFDDGLAILIFGFAAALAKSMLLADLHVAGASDGALASLQQPMMEIVGSLAIGVVLGVAFCWLNRRLQTSRDTLIMIVGTVLVATGISTWLHMSLILTNMVIGFILVNTQREAVVRQVADALHDLMPMMFILFFCLAGAHLNLATLPSLGAVGVAYVLARTGGLMGGARLGAMFGHVVPAVKKYVGMGILSQAGVAIGLSLIISTDLRELAALPKVAAALAALPAAERSLYDPLRIGTVLITSITATCIFFEIIGPILTKIALQKAGEIPPPDGSPTGAGPSRKAEATPKADPKTAS